LTTPNPQDILSAPFGLRYPFFPKSLLGSKNEEVVCMMIVRLLLVLIALHLIAYFPDFVRAGDDSTFRCGTDLIQLGDSNYRVMAKCGPPSSKESIGTNYRYATLPAAEFLDMERWIYNRGSTDFIYSLMFQGGSLTEISRGGRGF
jgi:hypothetical protein